MKKAPYGTFVVKIRRIARVRAGFVRASDLSHFMDWNRARHMLLSMARQGNAVKLPCGTLPGKWEPCYKISQL